MTEPISLLDLRKKTAVVEIGDGKSLTIQGLTAREICDHLDAFPLLRTVSVGSGIEATVVINESPAALAAWVASACGQHRNPEAERIATEELTLDEASEIAERSLSLTFSKGFGPFAGRLAAVLGYLTAAPGKVPATASPKPSRPVAPQPTIDPGTSPQDNSPQNSSSETEGVSEERQT